MIRQLLDSLAQDLAFALRTLARSRAFAAAALLTLALGIGVNTAVFSVVNGILLAPLPYRDPSRLVAVWPGHFTSAAELEYLQEHARSYEGGVASFSPGWGMALTRPDAAFQLSGARTSTNFFSTLGVQPIIGRTFRDGESATASNQVAVLSHALWRDRFGSDSAVVGRSIVLDGTPTLVIGVMPSGFAIFQHDAQLWMPIQVDRSSPFYKGATAFLIGRLRPGSSAETALAELKSLVPDLRSTLGFEKQFGQDVGIVALGDYLVGNLRPMLLVLLGAVGFIVLIAGANVGNLLLARAGGRTQEMAVRSALGASRGRIVRQLLSESVVLAVGGGLLGLALGVAGVQALRGILPADVPRLADVAIDVRVLAVCAAVTLGIGIIFGLAPALVASRQDLQGVLRGGRGAERGGIGRRVRGALVVAEVALAVVLVIGASLMLESMWRFSRVDPGFRAANVMTLRVQPTGPAFTGREQRARYFVEVVEQVRSTPGVLVAGAIHHLPLTGFDWHRDTEVEGRVVEQGATPFRPGFRTVAGDYFRAMEIPIRSGREFAESDAMGMPGVAMINETFARAMFPNENPIGRRLRFKGGGARDSATIIGVVGDVRHVALATPPEAEFFLSARQFPQGAMAIVARTAGDPTRSARAIYDRVAAVDHGVPISDLRPLEALTTASVAQPRVVTLLLVVFAIVGIVLGAVGIYGVVNHAVTSRTREIGIRIALGAARARVAAVVLRDGVAHAAAGVVLGVSGALALSRMMAALVFGVSPTNPAIYVAVSCVLLLTAVVASYLPARRAARVDPVTALRSE